MKKFAVVIILMYYIISALPSCYKMEIERDSADFQMANHLLVQEGVLGPKGAKFSIYDADQFADGSFVFYGTMGNYSRALGIINPDMSIAKSMEIDYQITKLQVIPQLNGSNMPYIFVTGYRDDDLNGQSESANAVFLVYDRNLALVHDYNHVVRNNNIDIIYDFTLNTSSNEIFLCAESTIIYFNLTNQTIKNFSPLPISSQWSKSLRKIHLVSEQNGNYELRVGLRVSWSEEPKKTIVGYSNGVTYGSYNLATNVFTHSYSAIEESFSRSFTEMLVCPNTGNVYIVSKIYDTDRPLGDYYWTNAKINVFDSHGNSLAVKQLQSSYDCIPNSAKLVGNSLLIACKTNSYYRIDSKFMYGLGLLVVYNYVTDSLQYYYFGNQELCSGFNKIIYGGDNDLHLFGYFGQYIAGNNNYEDWYDLPDAFQAWYCRLKLESIVPQ